jgi:hypothetical protein
MDKPEADRLFRLYIKARTEFERVYRMETIPSDAYEESREQATAALRKYQDYMTTIAVAEGQYDVIGWRPGRD